MSGTTTTPQTHVKSLLTEHPPSHPQSKTSSPSTSPPLPISPYQSPTISVKRVETATARTADRTSSPPQVIVHVGRRSHRRRNSSPSGSSGHSRSNSLTDARAVDPSRTLRESGKTKSTPALDVLKSIHDQLSESEKVLSDLTKELILTQKALAVKKEDTDSPGVENSTSATEVPSPESSNVSNGKPEEEEDSARDIVPLGELINSELLLNSQKSPRVEHPHRSPSTSSSTTSDVSTIVPRDLVPSRCSALSLPEEAALTNGQNSTSRESEANLSVPHAVTPRSPVTADPEGFTNPLSDLPRTGSPETCPSEVPTIEYSGSQTTFRNHSPVVDVDGILAGDTCTEEEPVQFPSLTVSSPSLLPEPSLASSSEVPNHSPHLNHISEQEDPEEDPSSLNTDFLTVLPHPQRRTHPGFHSSSSSLDSTACSVIEVSYTYTTAEGESDEVSSSYSPLQQDSADTNTPSSSYCSSSSELEADTFEVVPTETLDDYLVDLGDSESDEISPSATGTDSNKNLTRYNSLPNFDQANLETIPEEMAVTTQVMRIYPAQSVGEISSSVNVPHHRVHIPSSTSGANGPDSPSKCAATDHGSSTIVCVSPSTPTPSDDTAVKVVGEESFVQEVEPPALMAAPIQILEDGEEEEEVDAQLVAPRDRKISGVSQRVISTLCRHPLSCHTPPTIKPLLVCVFATCRSWCTTVLHSTSSTSHSHLLQ